MRKSFIFLIVVIISVQFSAFAAKNMEPWQDPAIFQENRLPMSATFTTDQQKIMPLGGIWKFKWYDSVGEQIKGFEAIEFDDSQWDNMPVPGMWELNGFGDPVYLNVGYPWRGNYENNPPFVPTFHNHVGQYRRTFILDGSWIGKQICLCIGSATSNVRVWVNGKMAGYSEDSKLEARFDITKYVKAGENLIALEIFRWCDGTYLEDQDFNRFTGIARDVYIYTREKNRIEDVNVSGDMHGNYDVKITTSGKVSNVKISILDKDGEEVAHDEAAPSRNIASFHGKIQDPALWSAEIPNLYTLKVQCLGKTGIFESTSIRFGFRTSEVVGSKYLLNGQPILIKGVNRHEMNTFKGYVVTREDMIRDLKIMKELNVNAIRTCHYPNDPEFLALCDEYGFYVVDEGNIESHGMGFGDKTLAKRDDFKAAHLARDSRMVKRDFNHPSVVIWSLGNEAGDGPNFTACYQWIKKNDPTRPVQYERAGDGDNTDIRCPMYWSPESCEKYVASNPKKPLIQCEYSHSKANSLGYFNAYWDLVRKYPSYQGGFIWDFVDQALWWPVEDEGTDHVFRYGGDWNDYDPSDFSYNNDGIITADRIIQPEAYEARYQHREIHTTYSGKGVINIFNEYFFKDLSTYRLKWTLEEAGTSVAEGIVENLDVSPQQTVSLNLNLPEYKTDKDLYLKVCYLLKAKDGLLDAGTEVSYDQFMIHEDDKPVFVPGSMSFRGSKITYEQKEDNEIFSGSFVYNAGWTASWKAMFDKATGFLVSYQVNGSEMLKGPLMPQFGRAPVENDTENYEKMKVWMYPEFKIKNFSVQAEGSLYLISAEYEPIANGAASVIITYKVHPDGSISTIESMKDAGGLSNAPNLYRFGMTLAMPGKYSILDFYGNGPWENYIDRNLGTLVGHYVQNVCDQYFYGYVRTQESGTHTGLRFMRVLDENGTGMEISSGTKFSGSAIPFSVKELDFMINGTPKRANPTNNRQEGESRHSLLLKKLAHENDRSKGTTYVNFEIKQAAIGGVYGWENRKDNPCLVYPEERSFGFVIRPIAN